MSEILNSRNLKEIRWSGKKLSKEQEREYIERYQKDHNDEEAANALIVNNIALVKKVISCSSPQESYFDDLLVEGVTGLLHAVEKFDLDRGNRLSTYAYHYIRLNISRFIDSQTKTISIPINKTSMIRHSLKEGGYENLPDDLKAIARNNELLSLDYQIETSQSQEKTIYDIIPDDAPTPEQLCDEASFRDALIEIIDTLPPREAYVLKSYCGIGETKKNFNDMSGPLGVTHQRISQIFKSARQKLSEEPRASKLRELAKLYDKADFI